MKWWEVVKLILINNDYFFSRFAADALAANLRSFIGLALFTGFAAFFAAGLAFAGFFFGDLADLFPITFNKGKVFF